MHRLGVAGGVTTGQRTEIRVLDPECGRVDVVHADLAVAQFVDGGGGRDRELVEPVVTVEDERAFGAELGQHRHQTLGHRRVGHTHDLALDTGRVGKRRNEVEGGGRAELAARGRGEAQPCVVTRREAEADPDFADAASNAFGAEIDDHAERLEHVGRAALRRSRASTVFCDARAGRGRDQRGHGGDVHRAGAIATGTTRVDDRTVDAREIDALREAQHGAHQRGELGGGLALRTKRDRESGDLRVGGLAREDRCHRLFDDRDRKVLAPDQTSDRVRPQWFPHTDEEVTGGSSIGSLTAGRWRDRQAVLRRWRTMRRRSFSVRPPHTPCFSRAVIEYSRHGSRTGQTMQMRFASSAASSADG